MEPLEESIWQSERRFRAIVSLAADAIICIDDQQRIDMFNDGAEHMFGYTRAEMFGQPLARLIPQRFHARHARHVDRFKTSDIGARLMGQREPIFAIRRNGEEFPAEATISKIDVGGGQILTVILRDATERRDAEKLLEARVAERTQALQAEIRQREAAQSQLVRAQRMEAFGQMTGGVAHDFNNLLTVIAGNLELLEKTALDERQRKLLRRALDASGLGARLTQRLLTFARRSRLEPSNLDLNVEVGSVIDLLGRTLGEEVQISKTLAADLWPIQADASEVESAIVNLAINARDAMPGGGRLMIETANVTIDDQAVAAKSNEDLSPGQYVRLSVSDTGSGMSPEVLQRAFEPFFTTKEPGRGTGLGLATIYGFAKQSGGHVTIYSEPGVGTTVNLYLPKIDSGPDPIVHPATTYALPASEGKTVLLVEDNPAVRELAIERLERLGYNVVACDNGPAAMTALGASGQIDLVFSDVIMPGGMSGHDLAAWIATNRPDLPVVLTSGFAEPVVRAAGGAPDSVRILRKPYAAGEMARAIGEALARQAAQPSRP